METDTPADALAAAIGHMNEVAGLNNYGVKASGEHRRVLPVLRYPRNVVIYQYPLFWVILLVIFLIFIIQNYPNFF